MSPTVAQLTAWTGVPGRNMERGTGQSLQTLWVEETQLKGQIAR